MEVEGEGEEERERENMDNTEMGMFVSACPHLCAFVVAACHRKSGTAMACITVQSVQIGLCARD